MEILKAFFKVKNSPFITLKMRVLRGSDWRGGKSSKRINTQLKSTGKNLPSLGDAPQVDYLSRTQIADYRKHHLSPSLRLLEVCAWCTEMVIPLTAWRNPRSNLISHWNCLYIKLFLFYEKNLCFSFLLTLFWILKVIVFIN